VGSFFTFNKKPVSLLTQFLQEMATPDIVHILNNVVKTYLMERLQARMTRHFAFPDKSLTFGTFANNFSEGNANWTSNVNKKLTNVVKSAKQQQAYRTMRKRSTIDTAHAHRACFPSPMHTFM